MNMNTAVILAGGKSRRMSFNKQNITVDGRLIAVYIADLLSSEFEQVIINSNSRSLYGNCPYPIIADEMAGCGPLAGIYTGLKASESDFTYFIGCDMPFVNLAYIKYLKKQLRGTKANINGILTTTGGFYEPLNAFYNKNLLSPIKQQLFKGERQVSKLCKDNNMLVVPEEIVKEFDPEGLMAINLNTLEEVEKYLFYGDIFDFAAI